MAPVIKIPSHLCSAENLLDSDQDHLFSHFLKPFQLLNGHWTSLLFQDTKYPISEVIVRKQSDRIQELYPTLSKTNLLDFFKYKEFKTKNAVLENIQRESPDLFADYAAACLFVQAYLTHSPPGPWAVEYLKWKMDGPGMGIMADGSICIVTDDGVNVCIDLQDIFKSFENEEIDWNESNSTVSIASSSEMDHEQIVSHESFSPENKQHFVVANEESISIEAEEMFVDKDKDMVVGEDEEMHNNNLVFFSQIAIEYFQNLQAISRKKYAHLSLEELEESSYEILAIAYTQSHDSHCQDFTNQLLQIIQNLSPSSIRKLLEEFPKYAMKSNRFIPYLTKVCYNPSSIYMYQDQKGLWNVSHAMLKANSNRNMLMKSVVEERPDIRLFWSYCAVEYFYAENSILTDGFISGDKYLDIYLAKSKLPKQIEIWLNSCHNALFFNETELIEKMKKEILEEYIDSKCHASEIINSTSLDSIKSAKTVEAVKTIKDIKEISRLSYCDEKNNRCKSRKANLSDSSLEDHIVPF